LSEKLRYCSNPKISAGFGSQGIYPSEKYESQLGLFFTIYAKIKNVPNQPDMV
jgi:hypothetical protein